jgi:peroxiredoxin
VNLRECLLRGPALVEFIRGTWDPNARERISLLDAARPRLDERAVRVLVVACEREDSARRYLEANPSPLSLLLDAEGAVARSWGVFERFSFGAFRVARPASFVVDRCGFVRFAHVGRSPIDAAPLDAVEGVLAALEREVRAT